MVSRRLASIVNSPTMKISATAKKLGESGLDVIDLGVGEPDFATPQNICEAAYRSIQMGETHYTPSDGIPELRAAIARKLRDENLLDVSPEDVIVTPGAKMAVFGAIQSVIDEGDECLLIGPSWVSYEPCVTFAGGRVGWVEVDENFMPVNLAEAITQKTRLIVVNSPSNPTGAVFDQKVLEEVRDLAVDKGLYVLSDEIYEKIIYGLEHISIGTFPGMMERTITVNGFSKSYAMTGWRLGYFTAPREISQLVSRLLSHSVSHATSFVQRAGVVALLGPQQEVQNMVAEFRVRRDLLVKGLRDLGIKCSMPGGAFYVFPDVGELGGGDEFAERLLKEKLIAATPGSAFGPGGRDHIRISYAASQDRLRQALLRIGEMLC